VSERVRLDKSQRQRRIVAELRASPAVRIVELAERFAVNTETIRRDLDELSAKGLVDRTYGGATIRHLGLEPDIRRRFTVNREGRERMARLAAGLVARDEVLMVDSGATTTIFSRRLAAAVEDSGRVGVTVITNGLDVAMALGQNRSIRTVVCPGDYQAAEGGVFGPDTLTHLERFRAHSAVIGAGAVSEAGVSDVHTDANWVKRAMLRQAIRQILLVDCQKLGNTLMDITCPLTAVSDIVVDARPERKIRAWLDRAGVELHVAG
jgi:DeoR/GlpR family transcriptional regulator of sugar metabolism